LIQKKRTLKSDIRKAGITDKDEAFLDSFSDALTSEDKPAASSSKDVSDEAVSQTLQKAKKMNDKIFKEIHPVEYQKKEDLRKQKEEEEKEYKHIVRERMSQLKEEVNMSIEDFI